MQLKIRNITYDVIKDDDKTVDPVKLEEMITDYYDNFDYIVGDWAYGKVRLKGFYESNNKLKKEHNDIKNVDNYIEKNCAYGCKYFILKKLKIENK